jgi:hypothetical protein
VENLPAKPMKFYSDINVWHWAIFSASRSVEKERRQVFEIRTEEGKHRVVVEYGERIPAWVELKVFFTIEYVFGKKFDFDRLREDAEKAIELERQVFCKEHSIDNPSDLTGVDEQHIIYNAMDRLRNDYRLYLDIGDIANMLYPGKRANSAVRRSLETLNDTQLKTGSTLFLGKEFSELFLERIPVIHYTSSGVGGRGKVTVSLNALHLFNLVQKKFIGADLNFIYSIRNPIAGMLYKYLSPRFFGSTKHGHDTRRILYSDIADHCQIKKFTKRSYIIQQLKNPLEELKQLHFIMHWSLQKELWGEPAIDFYLNYDFFENYYSSLDQETKKRLENEVANLSDDTKESMVGEYMAGTGYIEGSEEYIKLKEYYLRYRVLNL